jgi:hypothetical protein
MNQPVVHPVTPQRHAGKRWRRFSSYSWAMNQTLVPLVMAELASACANLPIAFVQQGEGVLATAMLGLEPGSNLLIGGDGRWIGGYVPALLRMRPFVLMPTEDGRRVLCVDEAAAQITDAVDAPDTEPFFDAQGQLAPATQQVLEFMSRVEDAKAPTAAACAALQRHQLLAPWPVTLQTEQGTRRAEGLLRVNEEAFNALSDEAFLDLRHSGALPLVYTHLLSLQHMKLMVELARARASAMKQPVTPVTPSGDLDLSFLSGGDTLRFS